ncbi:nucleic acid/nucleotide deaminase domain-containing protein [Streptomyces cinnamoneus]|uniref:nucleic acid/nucleotide deaminase domain-containing protein n=1 Tax=Streptomyces cinnamoneus TaxID=53446 RepID=UPI000C069CCC|nr:nucleic acid/nucleotide deaminase domain-containing protein [Streptomyces cinnamoneus]PPT11853.1 hypothetical protein CYQ11_02135 [Streptomyces cinnamoneus]
MTPAPRLRRIWVLRLVTAVVAVAAVFASLPGEALPAAHALPVAAKPKPKPPVPGDWTRIPLYDHPISQFGYELRVAARKANPYDEANLYSNAVVGFVDMTSELTEERDSGDHGQASARLSEKYGNFKIVEAADQPDLFASLGLDPKVTALMVVPRLNNPSRDANGKFNPGKRHAEMELLWTLKKKNISWERLLALWTERSPCAAGDTSCFRLLQTYAPHVKVFDSTTHKDWGDGSAKQNAEDIRKGLEAERERRAKQKSAPDPQAQATVGSAFAPHTADDCQTSGAGRLKSGPSLALTAAHSPLARSVVTADHPCGEGGSESDAKAKQPSALAKILTMPESDPGGIDFSSLNLRYMADTGSAKTGLRYSMGAAPVGSSGQNRRSDGVKALKETSDAFFVWLSLRPSAFWVNLNPNEPDRIVDSAFGRTDAGRILLQADLRMKKTVAQLIHPDTGLGSDYWSRLQGTCMSMRTWIVPGEAEVRATPDELYILDAPLKVKMETQYFQGRGAGGSAACTRQGKAAEERNESLFRSMILPKVEEAVNTAPEYADLRRVYLSRVAAEWYRDVSRRKNATYAKLIDRGDVSQWTTRSGWKPRDTFDAYVDSFKKGEFKVTRRTTEGDAIYEKTYVFGGVDLSNVPLRKVDDGRFKAEWPDAAKSAERSWDRPVPGGDGSARTLLLGGGPSPAEARRAADGGFTWSDAWDVVPLRWGVLGALIAVAVVLRRRPRPQPASPALGPQPLVVAPPTTPIDPRGLPLPLRIQGLATALCYAVGIVCTGNGVMGWMDDHRVWWARWLLLPGIALMAIGHYAGRALRRRAAARPPRRE